MAKVIAQPHVLSKLEDLIELLYYKEYFGFKKEATAYVNSIVKFIYSIPKQRCKKTKNPKYGAYYSQYKHNRKTTFYISFDKEGDLYLVKHVTNNHSADYPEFIQ